MLDRERSAIRDLRLSWIDLIWLVFLGGLALLPPVDEIHKQLILLAIVVVQLFEGWLVGRLPKRGPAYSVTIKILLATLLLDHTGEFGINSNYYPIFFLPVVSAAISAWSSGARPRVGTVLPKMTPREVSTTSSDRARPPNLLPVAPPVSTPR